MVKAPYSNTLFCLVEMKSSAQYTVFILLCTSLFWPAYLNFINIGMFEGETGSNLGNLNAF